MSASPANHSGKADGSRVYFCFDETAGSQHFPTLTELLTYTSTSRSPIWVDVQGEGPDGRRRLLAALSGLPSSVEAVAATRPSATVLDEVAQPGESDVVQLQPMYAAWAAGVVSCASGAAVFDMDAVRVEELPGNANTMHVHSNEGGGGTGGGDIPAGRVEGEQDSSPDDNNSENAVRSTAGVTADMLGDGGGGGIVWCSFLATERVLVTLHDCPFVGLEEMAREMELRFLNHHHSKTYNHNGCHSNVQLPQPAGTCPTATNAILFTTGYAIATLCCFTSETMLPDPTALLGEVDCIDEMVLLIAPGARDQPDLLRRVALLRRRISGFRARLYLKEKLLQELVTPAMRGSFVSRDNNHHSINSFINNSNNFGGGGVLPLYKDTLEKITHVADRLDGARDILNQANLNFVTGVSMRMSQSSANMDFKMQVLGQVSTICLPLNLIASIFGMNCTVPWQSDTHPSLHAFFAIIGCMFVWVLLCLIPTIRGLLRGNPAKAIVPTDT